MNQLSIPAFDEQLPTAGNPSLMVDAGEGDFAGCVDTGLGTTYERWALNRLLGELHRKYGFQQVLEGPGDGMTGIPGINSLVLGLLGAQVTLLLPDPNQVMAARHAWNRQAPGVNPALVEDRQRGRFPFFDNHFDLVWNFNVMAQQSQPAEMLVEMARVSSKYVLLFVPNRLNYAFGLHRLHHRVSGETWDHGDITWMRPQPWQKLFPQAGLRILETFWVDCPWWPDIVDMSKLLADFLPVLKRKPFNRLLNGARPVNRMRWEAGNLPYYQPDRYPQVHRQMQDLAYFETNQKMWLKRRFAHHVGILGIKEQVL